MFQEWDGGLRNFRAGSLQDQLFETRPPARFWTFWSFRRVGDSPGNALHQTPQQSDAWRPRGAPATAACATRKPPFLTKGAPGARQAPHALLPVRWGACLHEGAAAGVKAPLLALEAPATPRSLVRCACRREPSAPTTAALHQSLLRLRTHAHLICNRHRHRQPTVRGACAGRLWGCRRQSGRCAA